MIPMALGVLLYDFIQTYQTLSTIAHWGLQDAWRIGNGICDIKTIWNLRCSIYQSFYWYWLHLHDQYLRCKSTLQELFGNPLNGEGILVGNL
jgi:hypothetical protein